jgi:hypothetical protein
VECLEHEGHGGGVEEHRGEAAAGVFAYELDRGEHLALLHDGIGRAGGDERDDDGSAPDGAFNLVGPAGAGLE